MESDTLFHGCFIFNPEGPLADMTLDLPATPGVCLFTTEKNEPVLLLVGANIRSMVRRRLAENAEEELTKRVQLRPIVKRVWFRQSYSSFETHLNYFQIAKATYPDTFKDLLPQLACWFVQVNIDGAAPAFNRTKQWPEDGSRSWGPFADGKSSQKCVEQIQNMFDLCRCPDQLAVAPNAPGCSYVQMNRCIPVCNGQVSIDDYRHVIANAADFMDDRPAGLELLKAQMKQHAAALEYEKAAKVKEKIDLAKALLSESYRWVRSMDDFYVLSFQPGPKVKIKGKRTLMKTVIPFLIGPGWVYQVESFMLTETKDACETLTDQVAFARLKDSLRTSEKSLDLMAWIGHLLYTSKRGNKGLFIPVEDEMSADSLADQILQHFSTPEKKDNSSDKLKLDAYSLSEDTMPDDGAENNRDDK